MPKKSYKPFIDFHVSRFTQISESHCGPAVTQMLLSNLGIEISQEAIATAGGAAELIEMNGMRIDQLALAVQKLAPQVDFWFKDHSTLPELISLVSRRHFPVGVEWQGVFEGGDEEDEDEDEGETGEDDFGHYSIVTHVRPQRKELVIADPYKDYISQDRIFSFQEFEDRWWDFNEVTDPITGRTQLVEDYHMMFIITPKGQTFPTRMGMKKAGLVEA